MEMKPELVAASASSNTIPANISRSAAVYHSVDQPIGKVAQPPYLSDQQGDYTVNAF